MLSCLEKVMNACLSVTENCGHYEAIDKSDRYCVWAEDGEYADLIADNYKAGQTIEGTVDYFTKNEDDPNIEAFQLAFNRARIGWRLNSVQYEDETQFIHYEWLFRVKQEYPDGDMEI